MTFEENVDRWRRIFRNEEAYGEGPPAEQANQYRLNALMPDIIKMATKNTCVEGLPGEVDLLVSLSGFSPATTILAYEILKPKRVYVVTSMKAKHGIDVIAEHIVRSEKLRHQDFRHEECDPILPTDIYEIARNSLGHRHPRRFSHVRRLL